MGKTRKDKRKGKNTTTEYIEQLCSESKELRHLLDKARVEYFTETKHFVYTPTLQEYDKINASIELKKKYLDELIALYNNLTTQNLNGRDFHKCWELPETLTLRQFYDGDDLGEKYGIWSPNNDSQKIPLLFSDGFLAKLSASKKAKIHPAFRQKLHLNHKKKSHSIDHVASTFYICAPFNDKRKKALLKRCVSWPAKHDKYGVEEEVEDQGSYEVKLVIDPMNTNKSTFFDFIRYDHNPESIHTNKLDANNNLAKFPIQLNDGHNLSHLHINTQLFQALFPKKIPSPDAILIDTKGLNYATMVNVIDFALGIQHERPLIYDHHSKEYQKRSHDLPPSMEEYANSDIISAFGQVIDRYEHSQNEYDNAYYEQILARDYPEIYKSKGNRLIKTILAKVAYGIDFYRTHPKHIITEDKCHIGDLVDDRFVDIIPTPSQIRYQLENGNHGKETN